MTNQEKWKGCLAVAWIIWLACLTVVLSGAILYIAVLLTAAAPVEAQDGGCNLSPEVWLNDCYNNSELPAECGFIDFTAGAEGMYNVTFSDLTGHEVYLLAGEQYRHAIPDGVEWASFFYNGANVALVYVTEGDCQRENQPNEPPDEDMVNWQEGDSFYRVYHENGYVSVYALETGEGVLVLNTPDTTAACSESHPVCYNGLDTVTLVDPEGKLYEVLLD